MYIRKMYPTEGKKLAEILYKSVHTLCANDYTSAELEAWAPKNMDITKFKRSLSRSINWVAVENGRIIGFINLEYDGYVNRLFTHPDFARRGAASALLGNAEDWAKKRGLKRIRLAASKTALGFYKKHGYKPVDIERVEKRGIVFENKIMEKFL